MAATEVAVELKLACVLTRGDKERETRQEERKKKEREKGRGILNERKRKRHKSIGFLQYT